MKKIKHINIVFILVLAFFLLTCCSASSKGDYENNNPSIDENNKDVSYQLYKNFSYGDEIYQIYKIENAITFDELIVSKNNNLKYVVYEYDNVYDDTLAPSSWIINYQQEISQIINNNSYSNDLLNEINHQIKMSIYEYELVLDMKLDFYDDLFSIEKELKVESSYQADTILAIDLYIPYQIKISSTNETFTIYIPVKSFLGYKNNNTVICVYDDKTKEISYDDFININNVYKWKGEKYEKTRFYL